MRILVQLFHILVGFLAVALVVFAATWMYPAGREAFRIVGYVAMAIVVLIGVRRLLRARDVGRRGPDRS